ncbi:bifunctional phosphoribosylaminoimidazolecarboxamide formyltransferase/IMP cyclohydrolase [soil metagenome]
MTELRKIKCALISVSDKTGIIDLAKSLQKFGVKIISTGGTAKTLRENQIEVTEVADVTGFPEMMDGRVKTLHPKIHGAFLALRDNEEHQRAMNAHGIEPIDLVVVNLYPFEETIKNEDVKLKEAIEQIDIGGPAMIRSAAKNWRDVTVVTDTRLYQRVIDELTETGGSLSLETRQTFAALAFTKTSYYDTIISEYLGEQLSDEEFFSVENLDPMTENPLYQMMKESGEFFDEDFDSGFEDEEFSNNRQASKVEKDEPSQYQELNLIKVTDLRYGENPHQKAALYDTGETIGIAQAEVLHGKEMSYNNYLDADAAWRLVCDFDELACAIIKHTNPSGVGVGANNAEAYKRALATDPVSAFGGIVAFNQTVDADAANAVNKIFTEVVIAPEFADEALEIFKKKKNLRVLRVEKVGNEDSHEYRTISGGMLVQSLDNKQITVGDLKFVTKRKPSDEEVRALLFAWKVCKHVKSNAIVFANEFQTVGVGAGQMNRVDSVRLAAMRAERTELELKNTVLASDAFFPFRDNVDEAAKFGITAIIQPGGSVRDDEVIQAADEHSLAMVFTSDRHFKH